MQSGFRAAEPRSNIGRKARAARVRPKFTERGTAIPPPEGYTFSGVNL